MMEIKVIRSQLMLTLIMLQYASVHGSCTLPEAIRGNWISSDKGILNFTDNAIKDYPLKVFNSDRHFTLFCTGQRDNLYFFKSDGAFHQLFMFICFEFHQISDDKFWYQIATEYSRTDNDRIFVNNTATMDQACNRQRPFQISTFNTLLKEGSFERGLLDIMCPSDLYHIFSQGTHNTNGGTTCANNILDVCENRTQMRFTYGSSCLPSLRISNEGSYVCLLTFTDLSGVTYLHLWNNDTAPRNGFRINCLAYRATSNGLQGTLYPKSCLETQTATVVGAPGILMKYENTTKTCQDIHVVKPSLIGLYAGIGGGVLAFILLVILTIYIIYKTRCRCIKQLYKKSRIGNSDELLGNGASLSIEERNGIFVAKKPNKLTPVVIPELYPPIKVELLYEVESKSISGKRIFDSTTLVPVVIPKLEPPQKVDLLYSVKSKSISKKVTFDSSVILSDLSLKVK